MIYALIVGIPLLLLAAGLVVRATRDNRANRHVITSDANASWSEEDVCSERSDRLVTSRGALPEHGRVIVRRPKDHRFAILRTLKVVLDGHDAGRLTYGSSVCLPVAPGDHSLQVRMSWYESNRIDFDVDHKGSRSFTLCAPPGQSHNTVRRILGMPSSLQLYERPSRTDI